MRPEKSRWRIPAVQAVSKQPQRPEPPKAAPVTETANAAATPAVEKKVELKPAVKAEAPQAGGKQSSSVRTRCSSSPPGDRVPAGGRRSQGRSRGVREFLRKGGFAAVMAAGPSDKEKLYRVLVGPLKDTRSVQGPRRSRSRRLQEPIRAKILACSHDLVQLGDRADLACPSGCARADTHIESVHLAEARSAASCTCTRFANRRAARTSTSASTAARPRS